MVGNLGDVFIITLVQAGLNVDAWFGVPLKLKMCVLMSFYTLHAQMWVSCKWYFFFRLLVTALQHSRRDRHKSRFLCSIYESKAQTVFRFDSVCSPVPLFCFQSSFPNPPKKALGTVEGISVPEVTVQVRGASYRQVLKQNTSVPFHREHKTYSSSLSSWWTGMLNCVPSSLRGNLSELKEKTDDNAENVFYIQE